MAADDNPVEDGFIASLGRPGANITGLTTLARELNGKRLELLKEAVPRISRVAVLSNPATLSSGPGLGRTREAARSLGLQLEGFEVRGPEEFDSAFSAMAKARAQGFSRIRTHSSTSTPNSSRAWLSKAGCRRSSM